VKHVLKTHLNAKSVLMDMKTHQNVLQSHQLLNPLKSETFQLDLLKYSHVPTNVQPVLEVLEIVLIVKSTEMVPDVHALKDILKKKLMELKSVHNVVTNV
jgi:hypothetical protein